MKWTCVVRFSAPGVAGLSSEGQIWWNKRMRQRWSVVKRKLNSLTGVFPFASLRDGLLSLTLHFPAPLSGYDHSRRLSLPCHLCLNNILSWSNVIQWPTLSVICHGPCECHFTELIIFRKNKRLKQYLWQFRFCHLKEDWLTLISLQIQPF